MSRPLEDVRVLLVEDDPIIALDIRDTLEAVERSSLVRHMT